MPGGEPFPVDLRRHRPAAVIAIDLVKHSTQDKASAFAIQTALEDTLRESANNLGLSDVHFNHTGDGYLCTLTGDSSARVLDFISAAAPVLRERLLPYRQSVRIGLDYGLVHLSANTLTHSPTHFDQPSVRATRLEQAAAPDQILCTSIVRDLFADHYPHMFSTASQLVETKDRQLQAYEVQPVVPEHLELRAFLNAFIFRAFYAKSRPDTAASRNRLLIADDHDALRRGLRRGLAEVFPWAEIIEASNGYEAIAAFERGRFVAVMLDLKMGGIDGLEVAKTVLAADPEQIVVMISAFRVPSTVKEFFLVGGFSYMHKPFEIEEVNSLVGLAFRMSEHPALKKRIRMLSDDPALLWLELQEVTDRMSSIVRTVGESGALLHELLRHKAKHLVSGCIVGCGPGSDLGQKLSILRTQLDCILRLARIVKRIEVGKLEAFFESLVNDLRRMHPELSIEFEGPSVEDSHWTVSYASEIVFVVAELIDNAIDAVRASGHVSVSLAVLSAVGVLQMCVEDDGPGIPDDLREAVFIEGMSTKGAGRGLGLYLIRELVIRLGGSIEYERRRATLFRVKLPLTASHASHAKDNDRNEVRRVRGDKRRHRNT